MDFLTSLRADSRFSDIIVDHEEGALIWRHARGFQLFSWKCCLWCVHGCPSQARQELQPGPYTVGGSARDSTEMQREVEKTSFHWPPFLSQVSSPDNLNDPRNPA